MVVSLIENKAEQKIISISVEMLKDELVATYSRVNFQLKCWPFTNTLLDPRSGHRAGILPPVPQKWYSHLLLTPIQVLGVVTIPQQLTFGLWDWSCALVNTCPNSTSACELSLLLSCALELQLSHPLARALRPRTSLCICTSPTKEIASNHYMPRKEAAGYQTKNNPLCYNCINIKYFDQSRKRNKRNPYRKR